MHPEHPPGFEAADRASVDEAVTAHAAQLDKERKRNERYANPGVGRRLIKSAYDLWEEYIAATSSRFTSAEIARQLNIAEDSARHLERKHHLLIKRADAALKEVARFEREELGMTAPSEEKRS